MPGCEESRQPATIIRLDRYIRKYEIKNKFSPMLQADKRKEYTI
jgi:hypothetical protein